MGSVRSRSEGAVMGALHLRVRASALFVRFRAADAFLRYAVLVLGVVTLWFVVNVLHRTLPEVLWLGTPVSAAIATAAVWRTSCLPQLLRPTRRFWRHLCLTVALVGVGSAA